MNNETHTERYHGLTIEGQREFPTPGDYERWYFQVYDAKGHVFRYSTRISRSQATERRLNDSQTNQLLKETGLRRVRGKIELCRFEKDEAQEYVISDTPQTTVKLSNQEIRLHILQVLEHIRKLEPTRHILESFDARGFCEVLGIQYADYLSSATYLREKGLVADSKLEQATIEKGGIYITAAGIDFLEQQYQMAGENAMNAGAEKTRDQILEILYQHEKSTPGYFLRSPMIAEQMELSDSDTRYHLEVLHHDGYIRLTKTRDTWHARLDTRGKQRHLEGYRHPPFVNMIGGTHVNISGQVGLLNTGEQASFNSISIHVSQLSHAGQEEVAQALEHISKAVASDQEIIPEQREELLDLVADLSKQATLEPNERLKLPTIRRMVNAIGAILSAAGSSAQIWDTWGPTIMKYFEIG